MKRKIKHSTQFGENVIQLRAYLIYQRDKCTDTAHNWYKAIEELTSEHQ